IYLREIEGKESGAAPAVDLNAEKRHGDFVRTLIVSGQVDTADDISDGGLLVAVAEMGIAGNRGAMLEPGSIAHLFGEDQARYVIAAPPGEAARLLTAAKNAGVSATQVGVTGGDRLEVTGGGTIALAALNSAHESWFP